jgi:hypothetical protein
MLLACGSIFYLCAMASVMAGPVNKAVPTELKPIIPAEVKAPPPTKPVVVATPAKVAPKPRKCVMVERSTVTYAQGSVVSVPGMLISTCGCCGVGQVWLNGVYTVMPGQVLERVSFEEVCQ